MNSVEKKAEQSAPVGIVSVNQQMVRELGLKGRATIRAVITRADGTVEDLGVIAEGSV